MLRSWREHEIGGFLTVLGLDGGGQFGLHAVAVGCKSKNGSASVMRVKDKKGKWEASLPRSFSLLYRSSSRVSVVYSVFWAAKSVQVS